ncbi:MAG: phage shock protein operon transcriptional activator [Agarilytica sp.]
MNRIIGESSSLADTLAHVSRVAPLNRPILVVGERGSGKELIAERLHYLSTRWDETFHKVNCAAISEPLLDSELFGHEAGAFTGATKVSHGRFERANGGTLFLDELATMPLRIQEKILRIIEYGEFERLGGQKTIHVDVRIVGATNEDLPGLANQGKFRHDLLDRLAFDVIKVPALRQRTEDIPTLVDHFATRMCSELDREYYSGFSPDAMAVLTAYSWPGNIRELKNVVERSVCHWDNADEPIDEITLNPFAPSSALPTTPQASNHPNPDENFETQPASSTAENKTMDFEARVKTFEIRLIQEALTQNKQHQKRSAAYLGLTYHQFRALLKKYREDLQR